MILWRIQSFYLNLVALTGMAIILVILFDSRISLNGNKRKSLMPGALIKSIYNPGFIITSPDLCQNSNPYPKLFIGVSSAPKHLLTRQAIRETWKRCANALNVTVGFFIGNTNDRNLLSDIYQEALIYGDIIQGRFHDSYENLTLKTLSLLEWVDKYCSRVHHVFKTDDDAFINVHMLVNFTELHWEKKRSIFGKVAHGWAATRELTSKYYLSYEEFPKATFPDFVLGHAYLMTSDIVHDLYQHAMNHTFLKLEDVVITGIVAKSLNITKLPDGFIIHNGIFHLSDDRMNYEEIETDELSLMICIHEVEIDEQHELCNTLHRNPVNMIAHGVG